MQSFPCKSTPRRFMAAVNFFCQLRLQAASVIFVSADGAELWDDYEKRSYQFGTPGWYLDLGASLERVGRASSDVRVEKENAEPAGNQNIWYVRVGCVKMLGVTVLQLNTNSTVRAAPMSCMEYRQGPQPASSFEVCNRTLLELTRSACVARNRPFPMGLTSCMFASHSGGFPSLLYSVKRPCCVLRSLSSRPREILPGA